MHHGSTALFTIIWSVAIGLLAQILSLRWRIPSIVLLLFSGIILGPMVLGVVQPGELGTGLSILIKLAVAIILFEGALNLRLKALLLSATEIRNLISIGVLITWGLTTLCAHFIAHLDWALAILFGALMTVTGPTVVQPLLKRINVSHKIKTILEGEAILVDAIGAILAVAVLDGVLGYLNSHTLGVGSVIWSYIGRIIIGVIMGACMAIVLSHLMKIPYLVPMELSNLVVLGGVWTSFGIAEWLQSEAGIVASVAMGLMLQRETIPGERQLRRFKESLTTLSISVLFIILAANLKLTTLWEEGIRGVWLVLVLMFVIRPVSVFIATMRTSLNWREKVLIAWIGPRGIIAASVASLFGLALYESRYLSADRLPALTFLTIIMTVTVQGLTASSLTRLLRLSGTDNRRTIIVGANRLGCSIARILQEYNRMCVLIDSSQIFSARARDKGLTIIHGNALHEDILEQAGMDDADTIIATTANPEVNILVSQMAHELFHIKRIFVVMDRVDEGERLKLMLGESSRLGFGMAVDVLFWEHSEIYRCEWHVPETWKMVNVSDVQFPEDMIPAFRIRGSHIDVVSMEQQWQANDIIVFMTRGISAERAHELLDRNLISKINE